MWLKNPVADIKGDRAVVADQDGTLIEIFDTDATIAVENVRSYPRLVRIGMVILPTAATVAGADPEIAP